MQTCHPKIQVENNQNLPLQCKFRELEFIQNQQIWEIHNSINIRPQRFAVRLWVKKITPFCYLTVDGGWSPWKPFSACSATCGKAFHTSTRLCNKPTPQNGGKPCVGNATDTQLCRDLPLCASKCSVRAYIELVSRFVWVFQLTNNNFTKQG